MSSLWRRRFRTGSFRGIRFILLDSDHELGRRTVTHQYAKRDRPFAEDVGRQAKSYQVEAAIIGRDYTRDRDRLIEALDAPGPATLIHPLYGEQFVAVSEAEVSEDPREAGMARFSITFVEAGQLRFPSVEDDLSRQIADAIDEFLDFAIVRFVQDFNISGPQFLADQARQTLNGVATAMEEQLGFVDRSADEVADLAFQIESLKADASLLVNEPSEMARRLRESADQFGQAFGNRRESFQAQDNLFDAAPPGPQADIQTSTRIQQNRNARAQDEFQKINAFSHATLSAIEIEYENIEDAERFRDNLLEKALLMLDTIDDDGVYNRLNDIRSLIARQIPPPGESLPFIVEVPVDNTTNSLVLSYKLYGRLDRENDVIQRNRIENPAFVMGQRNIQVLSDA